MQSFSLGKRRKKRDGWLMSFTWLIVFVVVGLTGAWWWQNHKAQQEEIATMADQSSAQLSQNNEGQSVPLTDSNADNSAPLADNGSTPVDTGAGAAAQVMNFTADCWLQVTDASGKTLYSGSQKNGGKLSLAGTAPYKLTIGAPAAVQIQYQGKPVDLSRFVKSNRVARLTVAAQ